MSCILDLPDVFGHPNLRHLNLKISPDVPPFETLSNILATSTWLLLEAQQELQLSLSSSNTANTN